MNVRARRWVGWLGVVVGLLLVGLSVIVLLIANDLASHGWASMRDAAPVPLVALAVGVAILGTGIALVRRR